mmetsp:Transcript_5945/g.19175  ORF Transcript_5945/g.19175 Transcript_5945/m.19175 type:complete len:207 (-) Transcript_5945:118-738(-)
MSHDFDDKKKRETDLRKGFACRQLQSKGFCLLDVIDELYQHLSVGLRIESAPVASKHLTKSRIVFNDAVVHKSKRRVGRYVRMGILLRRLTMSCPSRVADPNCSLDVAGNSLQLLDLPHLLANVHLSAIHHRQARAVVSAVLQPRKPSEQDFRRLPLPDIPRDSAHVLLIVNRCDLVSGFENWWAVVSRDPCVTQQSQQSCFLFGF